MVVLKICENERFLWIIGSRVLSKGMQSRTILRQRFIGTIRVIFGPIRRDFSLLETWTGLKGFSERREEVIYVAMQSTTL